MKRSLLPLEGVAQKTAKTVRFSPQPRVRETLSRHDMSLEERCDYWIQEHEFRTIRRLRNRGSIPEMLEESNEGEDDEDCNQLAAKVRSKCEEELYLPDLTPNHQNEDIDRGLCRYDGIEEDLFEQTNRYCTGGIYDDEEIFDDPFGDVYFEVTGNC